MAGASALLRPWRALLQRELDANANLKHSTFFQLATVGSGGRPANRTLVFRCSPALAGSRNTDKIQISTDARSNKIQKQLPRSAVYLCRRGPAARTRCSSSTLMAASYNTGTADLVDFNWDTLGFQLVPTDFMYIMRSSSDGVFTKGELVPYGPIELSPAAAVLNYGQGLLEGLRAHRKEDGSIILFRPEENALRMRVGADRLCMPAPSVEQFLSGVKQTILANKRWVVSAQKRAKDKGHSDVLYLDPVHKKFVEEVPSCNIFMVKTRDCAIKMCKVAVGLVEGGIPVDQDQAIGNTNFTQSQGEPALEFCCYCGSWVCSEE